MKKYLIITGYVKKIVEQLQEISRLAHSSEEIQDELFSSLESLQSTTGRKIFLLFMEVALLFISRLLPILFSRNSPSSNDRFNRERMDKIDGYIRIHFDSELEEKEVADFIGMSAGHFSRFFNKMYQCSFIDYLHRYKIEFAVKLLIDTDLKITDICYKCGFGSLNQFNRVFKKVMKMPPGKYRLSVTGEDRVL